MDITKVEFYNWLSESLLMKVTPDTVFFKDLHLGEEDIETFFYEFIDRYKIDASSFNYEKYNPMKLNLIDVWIRGKKAKVFKAEHLYNVVKEGKWFDQQ